MEISNRFDKPGPDTVSGVALVGVDLEYNPLVNSDLVVDLMLFSVIRVDSVRHISGDDETVEEAGIEGVLLEAAAGSLAKHGVDALERLEEEGGLRALEALRPALLVVEADDHVDEGRIFVETFGVFDCANCVESRKQVVQARRRDELIAQPEVAGRLRVEEGELKVHNLRARHFRLPLDQFQKSRIVLLFNRGLRGGGG